MQIILFFRLHKNIFLFSFPTSQKKKKKKMSLIIILLIHRILVVGLFASRGVVGEDLKINNVGDFTNFINDVKSGKNYEGGTVYLENDLSLSSVTESIGTDTKKNFFKGVFDGQGHVISNFKESTSSSTLSGLFGYSTGLTIKNVVLDSSCSITNSYSKAEDVYIGGIMGYCNGQCNIENCVNMAGVTFNGDITDKSLFGKSHDPNIGGIIGFLKSNDKGSYVKNCANYGSVINSGKCKDPYIGGVVGDSTNSRSNKVFIQNCLNYGVVTHRGTSSDTLYMGGISGSSSYCELKNCLNGGQITNSGQTKRNNVGNVIGYIKDNTAIEYCYFTGGTGTNSLYGGGKKPTSTTGSPSSSTTSKEAVTNLNKQVTSNNGWNNWLLNTNSKAITFQVNDHKAFSRLSQVLLLPTLAKSGTNDFKGWFIDTSYSRTLTSYEVSGSGPTSFYGLYGIIVIVTFDGNGGTPSQENKFVLQHGSYGDLPSAERVGYSLAGWFTENKGGKKVNPTDEVTEAHTVYAHWNPNQYTITFDFKNGDSEVRTFYYNEEIVYPEGFVKTGYTFAGWDSDIKFMPAEDITITALWTANQYTVTFDGNEGTPEQQTKEVTFDSAYEDLPTASRVGYSLDGWFTEKDGGNEITSETQVTVADHHTLYAHWAINQYTITFNSNGGSACEPIKQDYKSQFTLPRPTKTGYTFAYWCSDIGLASEYTETTMPAEDKTLYAKWNINQYTLTFDFKNGAENEVRTLDFNEEIVYPENVTKEDYDFIGWDNNVKYMPAYNLTISAQWEAKGKGDKSKSDGNGALVAGIVVPLFLILIALVALVLFILFRKGHLTIVNKRLEVAKPLIAREAAEPFDRTRRVVARSREEVKGGISAAGNNRLDLADIFPRDFAPPTMRAALLAAELSEEQADLVCDACSNAAAGARERGALFAGFGEADAAAVAMYTYDFESFEEFDNDPFRVSTKSLTRRNYASMQKACGMLYLAVAALRKLSRVTGVTLYRGVRSGVKLEAGYYRKGTVVTWSGLASTSPNMEATKALLVEEEGPKGMSKKAKGTLFVIEGGWGYNVQPYSLTADDEEIVIEPERKFIVTSVIKSDVTIITLQMLDTPLSLLKLFERVELIKKNAVADTEEGKEDGDEEEDGEKEEKEKVIVNVERKVILDVERKVN